MRVSTDALRYTVSASGQKGHDQNPFRPCNANNLVVLPLSNFHNTVTVICKEAWRRNVSQRRRFDIFPATDHTNIKLDAFRGWDSKILCFVPPRKNLMMSMLPLATLKVEIRAPVIVAVDKPKFFIRTIEATEVTMRHFFPRWFLQDV